jgi:nitrite reductase (NADH) small subunit
VSKEVAPHGVGTVDDYAINQFRIFDIEGKSIGVVRTKSGYFALLNRCPHAGAKLCKGRVTGSNLPSDPDVYVYGFRDELVRCPWHGYEFELATGRSPFGTTRARAKTYEVRVTDGSVEVLVPSAVRGERG